MVQNKGDASVSIVIRTLTEPDWRSIESLPADKWVSAIKAMHSNSCAADGTIKAVALDLDTVVGFASGYRTGDNVLIINLVYVVPRLRRNGIGQELVKFLESKSGCTASMVFYNKDLREFYRSIGYTAGVNMEVGLKEIK